MIFFDDRRAKKDGTYPVSIKITYNGKRKYYGNSGDVDHLIPG